MPPLEVCLTDADEFAQEVVNAWAVNVDAGNAKLITTEFKDLFEATCRYLDLKRMADNHRQFNMLSPELAAKECTARETFAIAFKDFADKHGR